jgi:hypothetical protein
LITSLHFRRQDLRNKTTLKYILIFFFNELFLMKLDGFFFTIVNKYPNNRNKPMIVVTEILKWMNKQFNTWKSLEKT